MERRDTNGGISLIHRDDAITGISGLASVYYVEGDSRTEYRLWEGAVERIMPGAFDDVMSDDVRGLFNHDPNFVLGRTKSGTMQIRERNDGLHYQIEASDSRQFQDVTAMMQRGDVDGSSFSFTIADEKWSRDEEGTEIREITAIKRLYDVGPVAFPAYEGSSSQARSDARKSRDEWVDSLNAAKRNLIKREAAARQRQLDLLAMNS